MKIKFRVYGKKGPVLLKEEEKQMKEKGWRKTSTGGLYPPCVPANCPKKVHINCTCSKEKKVPVTELEWLLSQRTKTGEKWGMKMATVDIPATVTKKHDKRKKTKL